jgi:hypothetical protein
VGIDLLVYEMDVGCVGTWMLVPIPRKWSFSMSFS